jgi:hypothetical protein
MPSVSTPHAPVKVFFPVGAGLRLAGDAYGDPGARPVLLLLDDPFTAAVVDFLRAHP